MAVAYFKTPFPYLNGETDHDEKRETEERIAGVDGSNLETRRYRRKFWPLGRDPSFKYICLCIVELDAVI